MDLYQNLHFDFLSHHPEYPHPNEADNSLLMFRPTLDRPLPPLMHPSFHWPTTNYNCYDTSFMTEPTRPKLTRNIWEDEQTLFYQVEANGIHVVRRQDNDMINGTKLLNVVGMSRGKRDGILKNEKGRVVVKVGSMYLKGVWITFERAKDLAIKYKIFELLYPLFVDDPSIFLCPNKDVPMDFYWPKPLIESSPKPYDGPTTPPSWYSPQKRKYSAEDTHRAKMIKIEPK
ncbi:hypothetical protein G6F56_006071 [Rhizopus delemar]|uniref:HTH APSES-type domain-containing protein n=1 Tax=Rhizopus stolonifer TaxID=4846 RepID=A0A367IXZ1_RHIST|nr:hypothetical protein G6F56_006071 [Rhizopus delemar]RCH82560.1 hypothetical protein CU098_008297 [Rhizopus stolonifer]